MIGKCERKYEKCGEKIPLKTKDYILNMDEKRAVGVADTPLALYLLVACEMRKELQENIWALYHEIFRLLGVRPYERQIKKLN